MLPNHCLSVEKQGISWGFSKFLFVYLQVPFKCFQIIACQLQSNEAHEASQSFYSCIGRCNQNASEPSLVNWKAMTFLRRLKVSIRVLPGAINILSNHCLSIEKKWIPWRSFSKRFNSCIGRCNRNASEPSLVNWTAMSSLKRLKVSIRVLPGAINLLPSHCLSIEKQFINWLKRLEVSIRALAGAVKCFQSIACQLKSNDLVEAAPSFHSRIGKRHQHASKPFLFRWMAMNSLRLLEASESFYSCIGRWSPNASKSLLLNWKAVFLEVSQSFYSFIGRWSQNASKALLLNRKANVPYSVTKFLRALAGAIQMLPNHCLSIEKRWLPSSLMSQDFYSCIGWCNPASKSLLFSCKQGISWGVSKFLFVYLQVRSKCFQIIASQLKSQGFLEVSQSFYSCICRCNQNPFKPLLFTWKVMNSLKLLKVSICALAGAINILSNHCLSIEKKWIPWSFSKRVQFEHWQVQSKCFRTIAFRLSSNEFLETPQSFYSCIARCNQSASKSLLVNWKAINKWIEASRSFYSCLGRCNEVLPKHCLSIGKQNSLKASQSFYVHWQVQRRCFQIIACRLKSDDFLQASWCLKISIGALAGAIQMLPNHCLSVEKQGFSWGVSKFLFVYLQVQSKSFQIQSFYLFFCRCNPTASISSLFNWTAMNSFKFLGGSQNFYARIGRCNPHASKPLLFNCEAMNSMRSFSKFLFVYWQVQPNWVQVIAF